jgi:L-arabinokinase
VSGHGFGHSAREVEILRRLPPSVPLVVKTTAPEWFWREEVARDFELVPEAYDVGCLQTNSLDVDAAATLEAWHAVDARNRARADAEADDLRARGARVVVTDVASFPLTVASRLGIPGLCVANFTWADIYAGLVPVEPGFVPVVAQLEREYAAATLLLDAALSLPMRYFPRRRSMGLVARPGTPRRNTLLHFLGLDEDKPPRRRIALVYAGNWGLPLLWERLEAFADWHFVSVAAAAPVPVRNLTLIPRDLLRHADLVASVDLVISKPGYGLVGECLSAGTPLLYCPRPEFAEYAALDAALRRWPGGLPIETADFLAADWGRHLERVPSREASGAAAAPGAETAASEILAAATGRRA